MYIDSIIHKNQFPESLKFIFIFMNKIAFFQVIVMFDGQKMGISVHQTNVTLLASDHVSYLENRLELITQIFYLIFLLQICLV